MTEFVSGGRVPGVVTLLVHRNAVVHHEAFGMRDIEAGQPMAKDSIFQIMSMTKPFTGAAIMMLAEEGKLRINDPVEMHLPEFRGQMVVVRREGGETVLRKPTRPITIRDLMTHTSGLGPAAPGIASIMVTMDRTLADACLIYSQQPLEFEPGTRWSYSNTGIATLGRIVEVVSGAPFDKFLESRIFAPLGMNDTHIFLPAGKRARVAPVYAEKDGKLVKAGPGILGGDPMRYREGSKYSGPEHALYSTAADLARFYTLLLNNGTLDGKRLLSPASVRAMATVHTGSLKAGHDPGVGFGLTFAVTQAPEGTLTGHSIGTFGHGGAFGTYGWIDRAKQIAGVFMVASSSNTKDVRDVFLTVANSAVLADVQP
jgi:CubicO group peptidase (beta-lactamase class C family)